MSSQHSETPDNQPIPGLHRKFVYTVDNIAVVDPG
jgi:hypothetical protein